MAVVAHNAKNSKQNEKKALGVDANTAPQTPFPGARDRQNLISWSWSLSSPTDPVS